MEPRTVKTKSTGATTKANGVPKPPPNWNLEDVIYACAKDCRHSKVQCADMESLHQQLTNTLNSKRVKILIKEIICNIAIIYDICMQFKILPHNLSDEYTDPAAQPLYWISKWADYSDKYGFGYQLSDSGFGVMFNDTTKLLLLPNDINVHYIDEDDKEFYMTTTDYSQELEEKMRVLFTFKRYMCEKLLATIPIKVKFEIDQIPIMPHLHSWFRTTGAVVMHLSNGSVQLDFADHMKILLCPSNSSISYMDRGQPLRTYRFSTILRHGCNSDLYQKLRYALEKVNMMLEHMFN